jgi:glycosyltransferase involved in cell wall biosynthesis
LRMLPVGDCLRQRGHVVSLVEVPRSTTGRLGLLRMAAAHDLVVLQKKLFPAAFVALLRLANPKIIFDVDDAVMFHELERGEAITGNFFRRFSAISAASRVVVTGNAYIADFARAARDQGSSDVAVLPTPIDTHSLVAKTAYSQNDGLVIGWMGTKGNLHQLKPLSAVLSNLQGLVPGLCLRIVADRGIDLPGVNIETKPWRAAEEADDLRGFDIGIMPLEDSLWNRGKGGYKLLQYMAAGLPAVASPVGINADIVRTGENGFLARSEADWLNSLLALARDSELRQRIGCAARETIETSYSLEGYLERYGALIEGCLK